MHHRRRSRLAIPLLLLIALLAAACAGTVSSDTTTAGPATTTASGDTTPPTTPGSTGAPTTEADDVESDDTLVFATGDEYGCLDPSVCSSALPSTTLNHHIFSTLVQHVGNPMELVPNLATSWEYSDPTTVTFELDPNATFHNGDPVTADDVVYSFEEYAKEDSVRVSYVSAITSVTADGPNTVTFTTDEPRSDLMGNLARAFIMPRAARDEVGPDAFGQNPIGSGPYTYGSMSGGEVVLNANENWFRGEVAPAQIRVTTTTDPATRAALLQSGEVDLIDGVPLEAIESIESSGELEVISLKGARTIMYTFKANEAPFDDVRVRQAVNYAVDQESLVENILQGRAEVMHGPWASGWLGYNPDLSPYSYDPDRARELLAEAGYPDGFQTTFQITDGNRLKDGELAQAIQAQLADVGIDVELQPTPSSTTNDNWKSGAFEGLTSVTWSVPGDPGGMIAYSFENENALPEDPERAELVEATHTLVDPDEREAALEELGAYVHDQALWLFTHAEDTLYAKRADLPWEPTPISSGGATLWYWTP